MVDRRVGQPRRADTEHQRGEEGLPFLPPRDELIEGGTPRAPVGDVVRAPVAAARPHAKRSRDERMTGAEVVRVLADAIVHRADHVEPIQDEQIVTMTLERTHRRSEARARGEPAIGDDPVRPEERDETLGDRRRLRRALAGPQHRVQERQAEYCASCAAHQGASRHSLLHGSLPSSMRRIVKASLVTNARTISRMFNPLPSSAR